MHDTHTFPIIVLGKKQYRGELSIDDNYLYIKGYRNLFDYLFSIYIINTNREYTWLVSFSDVVVNQISQSNEIIQLVIKDNNETNSLTLRAKNAKDANQIATKIDEQIRSYYRKIEIEKALVVKYRAGDISDIHHSDFEKLIEELFEKMGNTIYRIGGSGDGGIDLQGKNTQSGARIIVQCKRYKGNVGIGAVRDFYGALVHVKASRGFFVTTGGFTGTVYKWVEDKPIELIDGKKLKELLIAFY